MVRRAGQPVGGGPLLQRLHHATVLQREGHLVREHAQHLAPVSRKCAHPRRRHSEGSHDTHRQNSTRGRVTSHLERFPVRMTRRMWSGRADAGSHWLAGLLDPRTTGYTSADVGWSTGLFQIHPGAQK
jgi:hypothetical protein